MFLAMILPSRPAVRDANQARTRAQTFCKLHVGRRTWAANLQAVDRHGRVERSGVWIEIGGCALDPPHAPGFGRCPVPDRGYIVHDLRRVDPDHIANQVFEQASKADAWPEPDHQHFAPSQRIEAATASPSASAFIRSIILAALRAPRRPEREGGPPSHTLATG
jgi:hypothetical protein